MKTVMNGMLLGLGLLLASASPVAAKTIHFGGYDWAVRSGHGGPGPNTWDESNVWLDTSGGLHLKISHRDGRWACAEVTMQRRLGFGRYEFQVEGRVDQFDDNIVLGLFNYPTADVGSDTTHEIDIEFARWGNAKEPMGNFTVWPVQKATKPASKTFNFSLRGNESTHRFNWKSTNVLYQTFQGLRDEDHGEIIRWDFAPEDPLKRLSQQSMPVHLNLWLFKGLPPRHLKEVEMVIRGFRLTPS